MRESGAIVGIREPCLDGAAYDSDFHKAPHQMISKIMMCFLFFFIECVFIEEESRRVDLKLLWFWDETAYGKAPPNGIRNGTLGMGRF